MTVDLYDKFLIPEQHSKYGPETSSENLIWLHVNNNGALISDCASDVMRKSDFLLHVNNKGAQIGAQISLYTSAQSDQHLFICTLAVLKLV